MRSREIRYRAITLSMRYPYYYFWMANVPLSLPDETVGLSVHVAVLPERARSCLRPIRRHFAASFVSFAYISSFLLSTIRFRIKYSTCNIISKCHSSFRNVGETRTHEAMQSFSKFAFSLLHTRSTLSTSFNGLSMLFLSQHVKNASRAM